MKTITKNINVYPDLTFEDCINELKCSRIRRYIIKRLMPCKFRFTKVDEIITLNEVITSITVQSVTTTTNPLVTIQ